VADSVYERGLRYGEEIVALSSVEGPWPSWSDPADRFERDVYRGDWLPEGMRRPAEGEPRLTVTQYLVSCLPDGHYLVDTWAVKVEMREPGRWAVSNGSACFNADGVSTPEPIPSGRSDDFKARYRFDLDTALDLARRVAPTIVINGLSSADVLRWDDLRSEHPDWNADQLRAQIQSEVGAA
jgi:hypothetical protein